MQRCFSNLLRRRPLLTAAKLRLFSQAESPVVSPISKLFSVTHLGFQPPLNNFQGIAVMQVRHFAAEDSGKKTKSKIQRKSKSRLVKKKKKKERSRAPMTPHTSKLKKYKIKGYSSFKSRFKPLGDGTIRRWRAGKLHNAHGKSKKAKRRLRKPELVHLAYAKVLKKLNFCNSARKT